jgi:hypothetical protein
MLIVIENKNRKDKEMKAKSTQQILNELPFNHSWKTLDWNTAYDELEKDLGYEPESNQVQEKMLECLTS